MAKYKVKFRAVVEAIREIEIKDESNPYEEARAVGDELKLGDFVIHDVYVYDLRPKKD